MRTCGSVLESELVNTIILFILSNRGTVRVHHAAGEVPALQLQRVLQTEVSRGQDLVREGDPLLTARERVGSGWLGRESHLTVQTELAGGLARALQERVTGLEVREW